MSWCATLVPRLEEWYPVERRFTIDRQGRANRISIGGDYWVTRKGRAVIILQTPPDFSGFLTSIETQRFCTMRLSLIYVFALLFGEFDDNCNLSSRLFICMWLNKQKYHAWVNYYTMGLKLHIVELKSTFKYTKCILYHLVFYPYLPPSWVRLL